MGPPEIIQLKPAGIFAFQDISADSVQHQVFAFSLALFPCLDLAELMNILPTFYRFAYIHNVRYEVAWKLSGFAANHSSNALIR